MMQQKDHQVDGDYQLNPEMTTRVKYTLEVAIEVRKGTEHRRDLCCIHVHSMVVV